MVIQITGVGGDARKALRDAQKALLADMILDVAEGVFAEVGYDDAKVQAVAKRARISLAKLYAVFPGKWELYRALHARRLDALMLAISAAIRGCEDDPLQQILTAHSAHIRFHMEHPEYLRMHLRDRIAWSSSEGLRCEEQLRAWQGGLRMMTTAIDAGIGDDLIVDEDPELLARSAMGLHQVALALWVDRGMKAPVDEVLTTAQRQVLRLLCPADRLAAQERRLLSTASLAGRSSSKEGRAAPVVS